MTFEHLPAALALIGLVILAASLLSGAIDRIGIPLVAIFLVLGTVLGPAGLGLVALGLESPALQVIVTLALVLVLFTDAIAVDTGELRRHRLLAMLVLGPGTVLPAALIALAGWLILDLHPIAAAIIGAALASTDPVLLRSLLRRPTLPAESRLALRLESGMNDVVLLPIVVLGMLALGGGAEGQAQPGGIGRHIVGMFVLGPLLGILAGYIAITVLDRVRRHTGVRRDYESLYALGVAFTSYALAEGVGGSGFLAAFAAGLTIAALDVELCDCFLDYGEATAEMFLLFTFVAFGASLIWSGVAVASLPTIGFAVVALSVRTLVLLPVLRHAGIERQSAWLIAWFGPRGLSSLLLILLPVFAGVPGAAQWFSLVCLVVLISVVMHGLAIAIFLRKSAQPNQGAPLRTRTQSSAGHPGLAVHSKPGGGGDEVTPTAEGQRQASPPEAPGPVPERIALDELAALRATGQPMIIADVRTERSYGSDGLRAEGAVRLPPDNAPAEARRLRLPRDVPLILYCT